MRPNLQILYEKKFKAVGDVEPTDIKETLKEFLPDSKQNISSESALCNVCTNNDSAAYSKAAAFDTALHDESYKDWKPPGELLKTIKSGDTEFEIWHGNLSEKPIQQLMKRLEIFVSFFIEGGTPIGQDEWDSGRWSVFFLYKKSPVKDAEASPYIFMGYSTVYQYYFIPPTPPGTPESRKAIQRPATADFELPFPTETAYTSLPCRSRISQFIILPPFQAGGNGARFYKTIFDFYLKLPQTVEITVEDPNESFDDLRDLNDLIYLRTLPDFTSLTINNKAVVRSKGRVPTNEIIDVKALEKLRQKSKIAPRQFARVVEMQLVSLIPTNIRQSLIHERKTGGPAEKLKEHEYHLWQLFVKQRLYRHNKDTLIQLDRAERIDRLDDALSNVEADYARLLRKLDGRKPESNREVFSKRGPPDEEEEAGPSSKKARVSDE
jgi:histone acetyltransferase 1